MLDLPFIWKTVRLLSEFCWFRWDIQLQCWPDAMLSCPDWCWKFPASFKQTLKNCSQKWSALCVVGDSFDILTVSYKCCFIWRGCPSVPERSLVILWWRGDSLVLYVFPSGGEYCTCLWFSFNKHMHVQFSDPDCVPSWEMFDILLNCAEVCAHACSVFSHYYLRRHVLNLQRFLWSSKTLFHLLLVCVYQDWSIDLNRTLSKREKKKPSEGVTLTGINQTGSDQPVQPAQSSSR